MKYNNQFDGDWIQPIIEGYKIKCCDCGLVHKLNFRISDEGKIQFQAFRDNRATGQIRRHIRQDKERNKR